MIGLCKGANAMKTTCPDCGRAIDVPLYTEATMQFRRTCRGCRQVWRILVRPVAIRQGVVSYVTFARQEIIFPASEKTI